MLKVNNEFEVKRDNYCWILTQHIPSKDKNGNPKMRQRDSYHGTLYQVCNTILDRSVHDLSSIEAIIDQLKTSTEAIRLAVDHHRRELRKTIKEELK